MNLKTKKFRYKTRNFQCLALFFQVVIVKSFYGPRLSMNYAQKIEFNPKN